MAAPYSLSLQSEGCLFEPSHVRNTIYRGEDNIIVKGRGCLDEYLPL
jgi:hypothetical protein